MFDINSPLIEDNQMFDDSCFLADKKYLQVFVIYCPVIGDKQMFGSSGPLIIRKAQTH